MNLTIEGGTDKQKALCFDFAHHVLQKLCSPRLYRKLDLEIRLDPDMYKESGSLGTCADVDGNYPPRDFEIEVASDLSRRYLLTVLAHELVHLKQYARGEMKHMADGRHRWYGKIFDSSVDTADSNYEMMPWEIEARGLEEILFVDWAETNNIRESWAFVDMFAD